MIDRRRFLSGCLSTPIAVSMAMRACPQESAAAQPWFRTALVGMEVGPTGAQFGYSDRQDQRYAKYFNGTEIVQRCVAAKSQYLVMWVRDGDYAYYDSKILPKAPGLGDRDPLREAVEEAKKHRLPVISYCVVQQGGHFLKEHPEWEMRGSDGKPLGRFSFNSGYLQAMKDLLSEQMEYGIDGFHIDMLDQGFGPPYGCWSNGSKAAFQKEFGHEMPDMKSGPTWDSAWDEILEFRYRTSQRFEQELVNHVRSIDSKVTIDFNYHGNPPFSWEVGQRPVQHAGNGDFVTGETGVWGFSALGVGLNAEFYRASTPGLPFQVAMQRGVRMYHDQTTRPLADMRWELLTLLAHGAFVTMVDKTAFDGSLDPVAYQRFGELFDEALRKADHFGHSPIYDAGLYYSSRSRDWIGKENPGEWMQSFIGAHKALRYDQLHCGVVLDENASLESMAQYPVVVLCNAAILSAREIELLQRYVERGGNLIVTGQTGQFDPYGKPNGKYALESLIGARPIGRLDTLDNWFRFPKDPSHPVPIGLLPHELPKDWLMLVKGPATVFEPSTATPIGELCKPHRTTRQKEGKEGTEWPMSADQAVGPAILHHRFGQGAVITFAGSPDYATASEHSIVEARQLLISAIRFLNPMPRVRIEAPTTVQTIVTDDVEARQIRVHFLAYNSPPQAIPSKGRPMVLPALMEESPIYQAKLSFRDPIQSATAENSMTRLDMQGNQVELLINDLHEVLVVQYT